jgi:hypothetical protein
MSILSPLFSSAINVDWAGDGHRTVAPGCVVEDNFHRSTPEPIIDDLKKACFCYK